MLWATLCDNARFSIWFVMIKSVPLRQVGIMYSCYLHEFVIIVECNLPCSLNALYCQHILRYSLLLNNSKNMPLVFITTDNKIITYQETLQKY